MMRRVALRLLLLVSCVLSSVVARAQPRQATDDPPVGTLRVLVFVGGEPAGGVAVHISGASAQQTAVHGAVAFTLAEGSYVVRLSIPRQLLTAAQAGTDPVAAVTDEIEIVAGEEVEAIVTLDARGAIRKLDVETVAAGTEDRRRAAELEKQVASRPQGIVRGKVVTGPEETPVVGARVFVRGATVETVTDDTGTFQLQLPEGKHDLVVIHAQYTTATLNKVKVDSGRPSELRVTVDKVTPQLDDFVVTAPHIEGGVASLVAERRQSATVDDVIGAEEMSRAGDSDAAGALKRVTGITIVGGQYVYVRGMGERYSATLLNSQAIPSPEPERRVIPLDLFSTDVLESVVIHKTPSADTPGEFGGGVVHLRTKGFPDELTASVSVSTGMVTTATFKDRPNYDGGGLDFLGTDDGTRELPDEIRERSPLREGNQFEAGLTREQLAEMGRLLSTSYNVYDEPVPLDRGVGFTLGDKYEPRDVPVGFLLSGAYDDGYAYREEEYRRFVFSDTAEGGLELNNDFFIRELARTIAVSGIFVAGAKPAKGHDIRATTLLLRITDDETSVVTGRSDDLGRDIRQARLRFVERQLVAQQLASEHELERLHRGKLEWRYAFSRASRTEPDQREYFYADEAVDPDAGTPDFQISARPAGNQRIWSDLVDRIHDLGVDYTQPLPVWNELEAKAKVGGAAMFRDREFETLRLTLRSPRILPAPLRRQTPEEIWSLDNINAEDGWILEDTTQPTDAYTAEQEIQAGYAMATVPITATVEVTAGARVERSRQQVVTFAPFSAEETPLETELDDTDVLPSATGKWQITGDLVLRGGYGRTVTRPDFRELSESQYRDVVTARRFVGNPELERGTIDNVDARLEYYFSTDEVASVALFYKAFNSPIEQIDRGGVDRSISWDNAESATSFGVELEGRRRFGFVHEALDEAFAAVNVALIRSEVTLGEETSGVSTSKERPLQGQSPYVVNLQVGYDDAANSGITAVLLYNVFGERIRDVGRLGTPDIFEQPFHQVDLVYGHKLGGCWQFSLKARNVLDRAVTFTQGDQVARRYRIGREFGASVSWSFE